MNKNIEKLANNNYHAYQYLPQVGFSHVDYILGANLVSLLHGDVSVKDCQ